MKKRKKKSGVPVTVISSDGKEREYPSCSTAADALKISRYTLTKWAKKKEVVSILYSKYNGYKVVIGQKPKEESKNKRKRAGRPAQPVIIVTPSGQRKGYSSMQTAAQALNVDRKTLYNHHNGQHYCHTLQGYKVIANTKPIAPAKENCKAVVAVGPEGEEIEYSSVTAAAKALKCSRALLHRRLKTGGQISLVEGYPLSKWYIYRKESRREPEGPYMGCERQNMEGPEVDTLRELIREEITAALKDNLRGVLLK